MNDNGFIITGYSESYGNMDEDIYVVKTDSNGNTITNTISGNIFSDLNSNCIFDSTDKEFIQSLIKVEPDNKFASPDIRGSYSLIVGAGTHTISQVLSNQYYSQECPSLPNNYTITFATNNYDTSSSNNFGNQIAIYCPLMWVDVATNIVRPCRQGTYTVNYCNNGTADADNSYIEVEFPNEIIPLSSSPVNWNSVNGNTYRFDLGTVAVGQCGTIYITDSVLCDAVMGSTLCVKANIFPDTICTPLDTNWDKSSIKVDGYCLNDSLAHFIIYNHGSGNMTAPSEYRIYANNYFSKKQNFQLNAGDSLVVDVVACGKTIRLEADQRPGHPGNSHPRATVENCGTSCAMPLFGFVNDVAEDDEDYFVEIDCQILRASYDPNEKSVKPKGITANRYVSAKDELEYQINFQNTGNDTAFFVVIRDTLNDNVVDIGSVTSGASSHPYSFRIYGQGILEWKFQNILLPDSNINESKSHGFVKFKVKQANNPKETIIKNDAGIYFDFNAPVVTDEVAVTVFDTTIISGNKELAAGSGSRQLEVSVYPNSTNGNVEVRITNGYESRNKFGTGLTNEKLELKIFDLLGREVYHQALSSKHETLNLNLSSGIYFYQVKNGREILATGKLAVE